jgi:hypothetical protein
MQSKVLCHKLLKFDAACGKNAYKLTAKNTVKKLLNSEQVCTVMSYHRSKRAKIKMVFNSWFS